MINTTCLDEKYSTTRLLTTETPKIVNNQEDKFESVLFLPEEEGRKGEGGLRTKGCFKKSYEDKPLISIITVVYNGDNYLEETIQSVVNQTYDNVEYIVIDGGSTDGTIDIIKKYEDRIDYWVSEKDKGMYDALNKGFSCAQGVLINFCNSDDMLYSDNVIEKIAMKYNQEKFDLCYGIAEFIGASGEHMSYSYPLDFKKRYVVTLGLPFVQPTSFWKRDIMKKTGLFDLNYKIVSDYDLISRILILSDKIYNMPFPIIKFRKHGVSFGDQNTKTARKEAPVIRTNVKLLLNMSNFEDNVFSIIDRIVQKINKTAKTLQENK